MTMPPRYYTAKQARELDRLAIYAHHIPGFDLMRRAGKAAFQALLEQWPDVERLLVFCGTGNNGGDGFVIAGLAQNAGLAVEVYIFGKYSVITGDALKAFEYASEMKASFHFVEQPPSLVPATPGTVVVDALLGTGLAGVVRPGVLTAIEVINCSGLPVLAVDIPSGLCSDTGAILGAAVKADLTVTFIGRKIGLVVGSGPELCGKVVFDDLAIPADIYEHIASIAEPVAVGSA